ncbi:hypothetical protein GOP47_0013922 [Adiantum capillus-veneris]|uniref:Uncharacterized protein n=1 Tax=Adiantum capillus-veneris TaxID=13818 RepID=A0A9D4UQ49_ADICA|nr:hypothetical protein GOP47_0013922 [Adiantum capillus-veneris]
MANEGVVGERCLAKQSFWSEWELGVLGEPQASRAGEKTPRGIEDSYQAKGGRGGDDQKGLMEKILGCGCRKS